MESNLKCFFIKHTLSGTINIINIKRQILILLHRSVQLCLYNTNYQMFDKFIQNTVKFIFKTNCME